MVIEDTSKRDPLLNFAGLLYGRSGYIEGMEAAGQTQLVNSELLPTDTDGRDADFEALGVTFGDTVDDLFRQATLPPGWRKQGSSHDMWSYVVDERGVERISVFYKAAFYDRSAHMSLVRDVGAHEAGGFIHDPDHTDTWPVLTDDERSAYLASLHSYLADPNEFDPQYEVKAAKVRLHLFGIEGS